MRLIKNNIVSFIKNNKALFLVFVLAQILTVLGFFVTYNYYVEGVETNKYYHEELRTFRIHHPNTENLERKLEGLIRDSRYPIQHLYVFATSEDVDISANYVSEDNSDNAESTVDQSKSSDDNTCKYFCGDYYGRSSFSDDTVFGSYLTEQDKKESLNSIVLCGEEYYSFDIGEKYLINGNSYVIRGISVEDNYYIPYSTFIKNALPVTGIDVVLTKDISVGKANNYSKYLGELFGTEKIDIPSSEDTSNSSSYHRLIIFSFFVFSLGIINLVYLFSYVLQKRSKHYSIFRMFGCSKLKGLLIYSAETLVISSWTYLLSALLFVFVFIPLLNCVDKHTLLRMDIFSFFLIYFIYICIVLCIFMPCIVKHSNKDIVSQYKE